MDDGAAWSDELGAYDVVAGEAVLRGQVADSTTEGEAGYASGADDAARCDEAEGPRCGVEVEPRRAAAGAGDLSIHLHLDPAHRREIDHEPVVQDAVSRRVVAASANGDVQLVRVREVERRRRRRSETANDQRGPTVDECVERADARCRTASPGVSTPPSNELRRPSTSI